MNNDSRIMEILTLTKNWCLPDWKKFRSYNNYWEVKDRYHREWYNKKTNTWNHWAYSNWLKWKLEKIKEYIIK